MFKELKLECSGGKMRLRFTNLAGKRLLPSNNTSLSWGVFFFDTEEMTEQQAKAILIHSQIEQRQKEIAQKQQEIKELEDLI